MNVKGKYQDAAMLRWKRPGPMAPTEPIELKRFTWMTTARWTRSKAPAN